MINLYSFEINIRYINITLNGKNIYIFTFILISSFIKVKILRSKS